MSHSHGSGYYQPSPFGDARDHVRGDSPKRYHAIRKWFDFKDKNVMDFGCAEGYFGFKALLDGAKSCLFIDTDKGCLNTILAQAKENGLEEKVRVQESFNGFGSFDVVICLDLWPHTQLAHPSKFYPYCKFLFISPSGNGNQNNEKLMDECSMFSEVVPVYNGYEKRTIYRCEK